MADPRFFTNQGPFRLSDLCERIGASLGPGTDGSVLIHDVAPLDRAGPDHLCYYQTGGALSEAGVSLLSGGACIVTEKDLGRVPTHVHALIAKEPRRAFALAAQLFYPRAQGSGCHAPSADINETAIIGENVDIGPNAVIGARVEIGAGSVIGAGVVIGDGCCLGRDNWVGPLASISHSLVGDRVTLHAGVRIGQDGFGVVPGPRGFTAVPQLGRVIIQDHVCIGAGTCVDRGAGGDTIIGEGTWIDNLVQVGHNVAIGRYCVIAALAGISGSVTIEDFAAIGGQSGFANHIKIGQGAQVGAQTGVMRDVAPGERVVGTPAQPVRQFFRTVAWLNRMVAGDKSS
jgi:UDP-3-O-[3-hydroxymyristoyl] glucosamine N-acyltransferase